MIYDHFVDVDVQLSMASLPWFLSLYINSMPLVFAFRVVDCFFLSEFLIYTHCCSPCQLLTPADNVTVRLSQWVQRFCSRSVSPSSRSMETSSWNAPMMDSLYRERSPVHPTSISGRYP